MTTLVRPIVQRSMTVYPNVAVAQPERSRTMPLPSASYTVSASGNVASTAVTASHPVHLRENSLVGTCFFFSFQTTYPYLLTNQHVLQPVEQTPPAQLTGSTYVQPHSQSSKSTSTSRSVEPAQVASPEPMEIDTDLPTLDLRALTLNRAPSSHRQTASRTHSQAPPSPTRPSAAEDDDEIEDLYGPPLGLPSVHAPPPPPEPPQPPPAPVPTPKETRLLPVLAAEDPRILDALERHEQREAARPRQGMHKAPAVRRAGAKRGGLVLVADFDRTRTEPRYRDESPRGVFASYFSRRSPGRPTLS